MSDSASNNGDEVKHKSDSIVVDDHFPNPNRSVLENQNLESLFQESKNPPKVEEKNKFSSIISEVKISQQQKPIPRQRKMSEKPEPSSFSRNMKEANLPRIQSEMLSPRKNSGQSLN